MSAKGKATAEPAARRRRSGAGSLFRLLDELHDIVDNLPDDRQSGQNHQFSDERGGGGSDAAGLASP